MTRVIMMVSVIVVFIYFVVEFEDNTSTRSTYNTDFKITNDKKIRFEKLTFNFASEDIADKAQNLVGNIRSALFKSSAVNIVKSGRIDERLNIEEWVSEIVGIRGKLNWEEFKPKDNDNRIRAVQLDMVREDGRNAKIQWLVNIDTKSYNIKYIEIDGKAKPVLLGAMELELWPLGDVLRMLQ